MAKLESDVDHIQTDISDIRTDVRDIRNIGLVVSIALLGGIIGAYLLLAADVKELAAVVGEDRADMKVLMNSQEQISQNQAQLFSRLDALILSGQRPAVGANSESLSEPKNGD